MVNNLINGISLKLYETFGSNYKIYLENVEQNLREPCFMIRILKPMQIAKLPNRYLRQHSFVISYYPKSTNNANNEMYEIAEKLLSELEYIIVNQNDIDNLVRGTKMRYEIVDDVLHFFVNYDFFVKKEIGEQDRMEELTVNSKTEG